MYKIRRDPEGNVLYSDVKELVDLCLENKILDGKKGEWIGVYHEASETDPELYPEGWYQDCYEESIQILMRDDAAVMLMVNELHDRCGVDYDPSFDTRPEESIDMRQSTSAGYLLEHNRQAYLELRRTLSEKHIAILVTATGTGKSYITAQLIHDHHLSTLVLSPKTALSEMWRTFRTEDGLPVDNMTYQAFMTLDSEAIREKAARYQLLVCDEATHVGAPRWQENIRLFRQFSPNTWILGLTADPVRYLDKGEDVTESFFEGNRVDGYRIEDAISEGILPSFSYVAALYKIEPQISPDGIPKEKENAAQRLLSRLEFCMENTCSIRTIMAKHIDMKNAHKVLVFVEKIADIPEAEDTFGQIGNIYSMSSAQTPLQNQKNLKKFESDTKTCFLVSVNILNEGLHIDGVDTVVMLRRTDSPNIFFQQLGRILSAGCNIDGLTVFDFVGNHCGLKIKRPGETADVIKQLNYGIKDRARQIIVSDYSEEPIAILNEISNLLRDNWTEEENQLLMKWYPIKGLHAAEYLPGRTAEAVRNQAKKLGILSQAIVPWTEEENQILRKWYPQEGPKSAERLPQHTNEAVRAQALKLGLTTKRAPAWTEEEDEILKKWYPTEGRKVIARLPGRTFSAASSRANKLGLKAVGVVLWEERETEILRKWYPLEGIKVAKRLPGRTERAIWNQVRALKLRSERIPPWSEEENAILRKYYPTEGKKVAKRLPKHTVSAVKNQAARLELTTQNPSLPWTEEENETIRKWYPVEGGEVYKRLPGRTVTSVRSQAYKLKVYTKAEPKVPWTDEEDETIRNYYPSEGSKTAERLKGRTASAVMSRAKKLGIRNVSRWTEEEISILREHYASEGPETAKYLPRHSTESVKDKAYELGLRLLAART